MTDVYKGKLRSIDLDKFLSEPPDPRSLYCPRCCGVTAGGWCGDCGFDWPDGCTDQLRAANPHIYGSAAEIEAKLTELSNRFHKNGERTDQIRAQYTDLHEHWQRNR